MFPFRIPFVVFVLLPIAEIYAFAEVGSQIGGGATVLWVMLSAVVGMVLLRLHGISTMRRLQAAMARGELPARAMFDSALLFLSAILLIIPGFITDLLGLLLLLPPLRWLLVRLMMRNTITFSSAQGYEQRNADIIEGEFRREDHESGPRLDRK